MSIWTSALWGSETLTADGGYEHKAARIDVATAVPWTPTVRLTMDGDAGFAVTELTVSQARLLAQILTEAADEIDAEAGER